MRKMALILAGVWLAAGCTGATRGEMVVEWWGKADCARHKGMKIEMSHYADGVHGLWFDLSELKRGTRVYHASLRVHTKVEKLRTDKRAYMSIGQGVFYYDPLRLYAEYRPDRPIEIFVVTGLAEEKRPLYERTEPLKLEAPQFKSFDVTDAVRGWVSGDLANRGLLINRLARWDADKTVLEVRYAGSVKDPPPQASGIKAAHRKGQTFLTWTEAERIIDKEEIRWKEFETTFKKYGPRKGRFYRIYRHEEPITARNLHQAERIDEIRPLSGYDARMHQHVVRGENWIGLDPEVVVPRYVIEDPPAGPTRGSPSGGESSWRFTPAFTSIRSSSRARATTPSPPA